jgi:hypothetical protein
MISYLGGGGSERKKDRYTTASLRFQWLIIEQFD